MTQPPLIPLSPEELDKAGPTLAALIREEQALARRHAEERKEHARSRLEHAKERAALRAKILALAQAMKEAKP